MMISGTQKLISEPSRFFSVSTTCMIVPPTSVPPIHRSAEPRPMMMPITTPMIRRTGRLLSIFFILSTSISQFRSPPAFTQHCGAPLSRTTIPHYASLYKNGACLSLPSAKEPQMLQQDLAPHQDQDHPAGKLRFALEAVPKSSADIHARRRQQEGDDTDAGNGRPDLHRRKAKVTPTASASMLVATARGSRTGGGRSCPRALPRPGTPGSCSLRSAPAGGRRSSGPLLR